MNLIFRRWRLGGTSARGIRQAMRQPVAIIRNDGIRNNEMVSYVTRERFNIETNPVDFAFRWGCTSAIPARITVNTVQAINWCSDKRQGRLDMQEAGVSVPPTWGVEARENDTSSPRAGVFVGRPSMHAQGRRLITGNWRTCVEQVERWGGGYVSELINKVAEYRVAVIQNRVAWVAQKTPGNPSDVAWNVARGGHFSNVSWENWPMEAVKECLKAAKVSGTDFCGVDVMVDNEGRAFVLEVNSSPSQTSPYRQQCFAKCFDYMIENNSKQALDDVPENRIKTYRSIIHPAVRSREGGANA